MAAKKPAAKAQAPAEKPTTGIYLDPKLAEIRAAEMAQLAQIQVQPREDATLDPKLAQLRDAEMKRAPRVL